MAATGTPSLASVLQVLASSTPSYSSHQHQEPPPVALPPTTSTKVTDDTEDEEYDPSTFQPSTHLSIFHHHQTPPPAATTAEPSKPQPQPQPPASASAVASTITSYPRALRHTVSLLSSSSLAPRIKHLITTAHTHEKQWHRGRQELQTRLSNRAEARQKLASVLASVGGGAAEARGTEEDDAEAELRAYDRKVYGALKEMAGATAKELARLGVPFFGTKAELVVRDGEEEGSRKEDEDEKTIGEKESKEGGKISERELRVLQGRMVELLEDMVKE
ncbi:MAG: hypothetical protein LQ351_005534 [Letrouitia transgressa]|nr:MAG: hypothetical protein LQ351_005534 [Letrouitia transgressa]